MGLSLQNSWPRPAWHSLRCGIDAVQALQLVQQAIWYDLRPHGRERSWLGERGWTVFYRFYGMALARPT